MYEIPESDTVAVTPTLDTLWETSERLRREMDDTAHLVVYMVNGDLLGEAHRLTQRYFDQLELWVELVQQRRDLSQREGCA